MIGVLSKENETRALEEFFQLFKTPWERYRKDRAYDVIIVTGDEFPQTDARLILIYGSDQKSIDHKHRLLPRGRRKHASLNSRTGQFPLYGELLTFEASGEKVICTTNSSEAAVVEITDNGTRVVRVGYTLFAEVAFLLTYGQPLEHAEVPTIELHIALLRNLILDAGVPLVEIPPSPANFDFAACLTHDIDFVGIRRHRFDHTMWGFLYRSTLGVLRDFLRKRVSFERLLRSWKAAASLPLVHLGLADDFWMLFEWYLKVEKGLNSTYYFIPFKHRRGDKVSADHPQRRASAYDIGEVTNWIGRLLVEGCEIGVHGIDAWHDAQKGREELKAAAAVTGSTDLGVRMHWLLSDQNTDRVLEQAGYSYDSSRGYNDTPGYLCGTVQAFRPLSAQTLLELPLHIQDGALFYPNRLGLSEMEAGERCECFLFNARKFGGVLTLLWHDRSPGPERFWGDFYADLVGRLKSFRCWFATARQVVSWFRRRREVVFERIEAEDGSSRIRIGAGGRRISPALNVRLYAARGPNLEDQRGPSYSDMPWDGASDLEPYPAATILG